MSKTLEVRTIIEEDLSQSYMYRIGSQDWQECEEPTYSIFVENNGPWKTLEDIPEYVMEILDIDGTSWHRKTIGWWCKEPIQYESKVYGPFIIRT